MNISVFFLAFLFVTGGYASGEEDYRQCVGDLNLTRKCPPYSPELSSQWMCLAKKKGCLDRFHCAREDRTHEFNMTCADPVPCDAGQEPRINTQAQRVHCFYCYDKERYGQNFERQSNTLSQCEFEKSRPDYSVVLKEFNDIRRYSQNYDYRCKYEDNYILENYQNYPSYHTNNPEGRCIFVGPCPPGQERIKNYSCVPNCGDGMIRDPKSKCLPNDDLDSSSPKPKHQKPEKPLTSATGTTAVYISEMTTGIPGKSLDFDTKYTFVIVMIIAVVGVLLIWFWKKGYLKLFSEVVTGFRKGKKNEAELESVRSEVPDTEDGSVREPLLDMELDIEVGSEAEPLIDKLRYSHTDYVLENDSTNKCQQENTGELKTDNTPSENDSLKIIDNSSMEKVKPDNRNPTVEVSKEGVNMISKTDFTAHSDELEPDSRTSQDSGGSKTLSEEVDEKIQGLKTEKEASVEVGKPSKQDIGSEDNGIPDTSHPTVEVFQEAHSDVLEPETGFVQDTRTTSDQNRPLTAEIHYQDEGCYEQFKEVSPKLKQKIYVHGGIKENISTVETNEDGSPDEEAYTSADEEVNTGRADLPLPVGIIEGRDKTERKDEECDTAEQFGPGKTVRLHSLNESGTSVDVENRTEERPERKDYTSEQFGPGKTVSLRSVNKIGTSVDVEIKTEGLKPEKKDKKTDASEQLGPEKTVSLRSINVIENSVDVGNRTEGLRPDRSSSGDTSDSRSSSLNLEVTKQENTYQEKEMRAKEHLQILDTKKDFEAFHKAAETISVEHSDLFEFTKRDNPNKMSPKKYKNVPEGFRSFESSGDNNSSLYQSISILLCGDESYQYRLRLVAVLQGVKNFNQYLKQIMMARLVRDELLCFFEAQVLDNIAEKYRNIQSDDDMTEAFLKEIIMETASVGKNSGQIQAMFVCHALGTGLHQFYQTNDHFLMKKLRKQIDDLSLDDSAPSEFLTIMWVNAEDNLKGGLTHVIPLFTNEELKRKGYDSEV